MIKRNETKAAKTKAGKKKSISRWFTYTLILGCALMLGSGFFFAAQQHFSSMDYGMKNSRLRKQIDQLEAEKRRLLLAREISLSPAEIKKVAKKVGILDPLPTDAPVVQLASTHEKATPPVAPDGKPLVVKTVAVTPAPPTVAASFQKPVKSVKDEKRTIAAE